MKNPPFGRVFDLSMELPFHPFFYIAKGKEPPSLDFEAFQQVYKTLIDQKVYKLK